MKWLISIVLLPFTGFTQVNTPTWGIEDTVLIISKTTDFGPVHDYLALTNNSGQDLNMRWICHEPQSWPTLWITDFTDPSNSFDDVQHLDSSDFVLLNPPEWNNKLIIGVQHQSFAHTDTLKFKVFPVDFPEDTLWLYYIIEVAQGNAWANIEDEDADQILQFNATTNQLSWTSSGLNPKIEIYSLSGQLVKQLESNENSLIISDLKKGVYIVRYQDGKVEEKLKISIVN
ncbi:T9SS type A sorting domain-containing protein [Paracrocinitomix mangrovi]|uniref:T9SS type A sorting domain-containing protein n=1 Tax=Paracrocinitomix mangrovi TaxID=2862509 RepID=UPI001C8EF896|nr:T9SS type A sorting domain-containing protein [Paracrocinitomix mangrovi]UKN02173.1 T9SS type A sorting domain-containing protein [Paracrocinitomix mangrovi]